MFARPAMPAPAANAESCRDLPPPGAPDEPRSLYDRSAAAAGYESATVQPYPIDAIVHETATGIYGYDPRDHRYGVRPVISALLDAGRIFALRHPGLAIGVGDLSKRGGGDTPRHGSHETGFDVDLRPMRRSGERKPTLHTDPDYARDLTQEIVDLLYANAHLRVKFVLFNDSAIVGAQPYAGHDNHLHVRFLSDVAVPPEPLLKAGMADHPAVSELRRRLNAWMSASGRASGVLPVTPVFDNALDAAVRAFQQAEKLGPDGQAGPATWAALQLWAFSAPPSAPPALPRRRLRPSYFNGTGV